MANSDKPLEQTDRRPQAARRKRQLTRRKLIDAAICVFAQSAGSAPVIDDVIRQADVSRGTFYNHFNSLDEVLVAVGIELNDQMTTGVLPVYDILTEPWQRFSVGFRLFLVRSLLDRKWASFVTRVEAWPSQHKVAEYLMKDLKQGREQGQFVFARLDVAMNFVMGASAHGMHALSQGAEDTNQYMDSCVHMALMSVGCSPAICQDGVEFSLGYLQAWVAGELDAARPGWALAVSSQEAREFLAHRTVRWIA